MDHATARGREVGRFQRGSSASVSVASYRLCSATFRRTSSYMGVNWWDDGDDEPPPGVVLAPGEKFLGEGVFVYLVLKTINGEKRIEQRPFADTEGRSD
jgi:hypothetical protein